MLMNVLKYTRLITFALLYMNFLIVEKYSYSLGTS